MSRPRTPVSGALIAAALLADPDLSHAQDSDALAKAAQNPMAAMIGLPFQNSTFYGVGSNGPQCRPDRPIHFQLPFPK